MAIDAAEVEALYRQFGPAVYRRCLKLLRSSAEAEDATQEVFVRVCRHLEGFRYGDSPLPWIYGIATRFCLNKIRDSARHEQAAALTPSEPIGDLAHALTDRQLAARVLSRFDKKTGLIAVYALVDRMTQEEIAQALGLSRKTVGVRLQRFLNGAQKYLRRVA